MATLLSDRWPVRAIPPEQLTRLWGKMQVRLMAVRATARTSAGPQGPLRQVAATPSSVRLQVRRIRWESTTHILASIPGRLTPAETTTLSLAPVREMQTRPVIILSLDFSLATRTRSEQITRFLDRKQAQTIPRAARTRSLASVRESRTQRPATMPSLVIWPDKRTRRASTILLL